VTGLSIVIPVYKGAQSLGELVTELERVLPTLADTYEVIMVDDGSPDTSWQVIRDLSANRPWLRGITLMRNYGQHNALLRGIRAALYETIITMDDDLQHPAGEISPLLEKLAEGYDVVYGVPQHLQHGFWRDMASQMTKIALQGSMGVEIARNVSAFRAFRTQVRDGFANYQSPYVNIDVLLTWGTTRFAAVHVRHEERKFGVSNYTFRKLLTHALNMITGFTILPLQLASIVGFLLSVFGFIVLVYVIGRDLIEGGAPAGFPFLASIVAIFSGAQLFALGIIGEYLARMHFRTMGRPPSVIREQIGFPEESPDHD